MKYHITEIKPYSTIELSRFFGICKRSFLVMIEPYAHEIGKRNGRYYTTLQVETIISKIGMPYSVNSRSTMLQKENADQ